MAKVTRPRVTQDQKDKIKSLKEAGKTNIDIAKEMKVTPQTVGNILKKMDATRPAMAKTAKAKDKQLSYDEIRAKYLQAQKDVETWKRELEKALKRQEKQIETDRKSLGL